jgi:hypothetical protein
VNHILVQNTSSLDHGIGFVPVVVFCNGGADERDCISTMLQRAKS